MNSALEQARTLFFQGIEHFEAGRLEQARVAFEESLSFAPGRPSVAGNLGITLVHLGRNAEAIPLLELATGADPAYADAWASLGLSHEALGNWPEAIDALEQAIRLAPGQAALQLHKAQCLLRQARVQEALQAFDQCLAAAPEYAQAWSARGSLLRELHRLDEAAACFEKALAFGGDAELNRYYLASVRGNGVPTTPPRRYVEALFDDYAADFQQHVVGQLRYQGYERLLRPLVEAKATFGRALDLGCGTGLCAPLLRPLAEVVDGVDISQAMLEQARRLGIYRELTHADIAAYLAAAEKSAGLVVAADVFIYVGDLTDVFRHVRRLLSPSGRFVFTVEAPDGAHGGEGGEGTQDLQLLPSLRYAHSEQYIRKLAQASGFRIDEIARAPIRYDQGQPVDGLYVYLA